MHNKIITINIDNIITCILAYTIPDNVTGSCDFTSSVLSITFDVGFVNASCDHLLSQVCESNYICICTTF